LAQAKIELKRNSSLKSGDARGRLQRRAMMHRGVLRCRALVLLASLALSAIPGSVATTAAEACSGREVGQNCTYQARAAGVQTYDGRCATNEISNELLCERSGALEASSVERAVTPGATAVAMVVGAAMM